ncbi:MAG: hypothetical protein HWN81_19360 [Candidatus Lokiarchaeota archaeon]|nr:hypothetical protein [Candidatus Lokiarchaeota archaeon]
MNIFALDQDPSKAAKWHVDKHVVKMVTETSQCLACALIRHNTPTNFLPLTSKGTPVRGGYHHHPSSIWAGNTRANFLWLCSLGLFLSEEYTSRYGKVHACEKQIKKMCSLAKFIPQGELESFSIAISEDMECRKVKGFDSLPEITQYRLYYKIDKSHIAAWKQNKPYWYNYSTKKLINLPV